MAEKTFIAKLRKKYAAPGSEILNRMFRTTFVTMMIIEFAQVGTGIIDGVMVSRFLGADSMAAVGLAYPYYSIVGIISGILAVGMQSICSKHLGIGNTEKMNRTFSLTVFLGIASTVLLTVVLLLGARPLAIALGAKGNAANLLEPTREYLWALAWGTGGKLLSAIFSSAIQLDSGRKIVQRAALTDAIVDIVLDGCAVIFGWGLTGMGLATAIAAWADLGVMLLHFRKKDHMLRLQFGNFDFSELKTMLISGSNKAVKRLANVFRPILLNAMIISAGGSMAMTAMSVRNNLGNFVEIPGAGIAGAVALLTTVFYGEISEDSIVQVGKEGHRMTYLCSGIMGILLIVLAGPLTKFYVPDADAELFALTRFSVYCLAVSIPLDTFIQSRTGFLQSISKLTETQLLTVAQKFAYIVASAFVLGKLYGAYGIIASYPVSEFLILLTIQIKYMIKRKSLKLVPADYIELPEEYKLKPGDVIDLSVNSREDISLVAEQIQMFCKGHKLDSRRSYAAALCMEEMSANIVEHGFEKSKGNHSIDIRLVFMGDDLMLRIRDNCPTFDVCKKAKQMQEVAETDPAANVGTKLVFRMAKDVKYVNTMETNTLIITI